MPPELDVFPGPDFSALSLPSAAAKPNERPPEGPLKINFSQDVIGPNQIRGAHGIYGMSSRHLLPTI